MAKKFSTLAKALKYVELSIEGSFGEGLTLSDFTKYDAKSIKEMDKNVKHGTFGAYLILRNTGCNLEWNISQAYRTYDVFRASSVAIVYVSKWLNYYEVKAIEVKRDKLARGASPCR